MSIEKQAVAATAATESAEASGNALARADFNTLAILEKEAARLGEKLSENDLSEEERQRVATHLATLAQRIAEIREAEAKAKTAENQATVASAPAPPVPASAAPASTENTASANATNNNNSSPNFFGRMAEKAMNFSPIAIPMAALSAVLKKGAEMLGLGDINILAGTKELFSQTFSAIFSNINPFGGDAKPFNWPAVRNAFMTVAKPEDTVRKPEDDGGKAKDNPKNILTSASNYTTNQDIFSGSKEHAQSIHATAKNLNISPAIIFALFDKETVNFNNLNVVRFEKKRYSDNYDFGDRPKKGYGDTDLSVEKAQSIVDNGEILTADITPYQRNKIIYYTSFGFPQIMGFNYKPSGFSSLKEMAEKMLSGDIEIQLKAWATFVSQYNGGKILTAMKKNPPDFLTIAKIYNGSTTYERNNYHTDLEDFYYKYAGLDKENLTQKSSSLGTMMLKQAKEMVKNKDKRNLINIYTNNSEMLRNNGGIGMTCWDWGYEVAERLGISLKKVYWNANNAVPKKGYEKMVQSIEPGDKVIVYNGNKQDLAGEHTVIAISIIEKNGKKYLDSYSFPGSGDPRRVQYDITKRGTIRALEKPVAITHSNTSPA